MEFYVAGGDSDRRDRKRNGLGYNNGDPVCYNADGTVVRCTAENVRAFIKENSYDTMKDLADRFELSEERVRVCIKEMKNSDSFEFVELQHSEVFAGKCTSVCEQRKLILIVN